MQLIPARIKNQALLNEVHSLQGDETDFHLWWLGQSGYLLSWKGSKILIDPYLSDSLTVKYASTNKPHIRMSERVIAPEELKDMLIISSSHNHTDHLDAGTLIPLIKNNPQAKFIIPEANRDFVTDRVGIAKSLPIGLNDGSAVTEGLFTFHGVPASHNELDRDEHGQCRFMGYVICFGPWTIYHSGDTLWYEGMEDILRPFDIDLALLPINGNDPSRGVAGNLDTAEAAKLGKAIGAGLVIPCHYDMFTFNTADPKNFVQEAEKIGQPYSVLPIGGHFSSIAIRVIQPGIPDINF